MPEAPVLLLEIGKQGQKEKKEALSVIRENLLSHAASAGSVEIVDESWEFRKIIIPLILESRALSNPGSLALVISILLLTIT